MNLFCSLALGSVLALIISLPAEATQTIDADIVVVGGGLSGLAAGLTALEKGATVVIFEKEAGLGGHGNYVEMTFGVGSRIQKRFLRERGLESSLKEVFDAAVIFQHWRVNVSLLRRLLENSGRTIDWAEDMGVVFTGVVQLSLQGKPLYIAHEYKRSGQAIIKAMSRKILERGGKIILETPVKSLVRDDHGRVIGVEAISSVDGETYVANARGGVVIATGGFPKNVEMLTTHVPDYNGPGIIEPIAYRGAAEQDGRVGDGVNMAKDVGAALVKMGTVMGNAPYLDDTPVILQFNGPRYLKETRAALSQPFLWVNKKGERFYNESMGTNFVYAYNAITLNGGVMYCIFDEKMKSNLIENGPLVPFQTIVKLGEKMTELDEGIRIGIQKGFAFKADTIEELAEKTGVDGDNLLSTIQRVNEYSEQGLDPDWGREPAHLTRFSDEGPYYALKGIRVITGTLGGVNVNDNLQALDWQGQVIPGLYVVGLDAGGLYDTTYDLILLGSASGFSLTGARLAADHIVRTQLPHSP